MPAGQDPVIECGLDRGASPVVSVNGASNAASTLPWTWNLQRCPLLSGNTSRSAFLLAGRERRVASEAAAPAGGLEHVALLSYAVGQPPDALPPRRHPDSPRIPHEQGDEMANLSHKALSEGHRHRRAGSFNSSLAHQTNVALTRVNSQSHCRSRTLAQHMHNISGGSGAAAASRLILVAARSHARGQAFSRAFAKRANGPPTSASSRGSPCSTTAPWSSTSTWSESAMVVNR